MKIITPTAEQVIFTNQYICKQQGNIFSILDKGKGKIESAIHSAFFPEEPPFAAGGIAKIAGALCFYLVQAHAFLDGNKRVGTLVAVEFMNLNGWDLSYLKKEENGNSALANIVLDCASSKVGKEQLMDWFDQHKIKF